MNVPVLNFDTLMTGQENTSIFNESAFTNLTSYYQSEYVPEYTATTTATYDSIKPAILHIELHDPSISIPVCLQAQLEVEAEAEAKGEAEAEEEEEEATFGLIQIKTTALPQTETPQEHHFVFTIDCSGSMSDTCSDGRTKMQHILYTLQNMIHYFADLPYNPITIDVFAFDEKIYHIIKATRVTNENKNILISKTKEIHTQYGTNLEKALKNSQNYIQNKNQNPNIRFTHIFMTDGQSNMGNIEPNHLSEIVNTNYENIFIGFGIDHDAYTLNQLAKNPKNKYYFIDALEKAGLVYGEVIHYVLQKVWQNVKIIVENGIIYDWKKNMWTTEIVEPFITADTLRTFHVKTTDPTNMKATLIANKMENTETILEEIDVLPPLQNAPNDLTHYIFRQKTQELLFECMETIEVTNQKKDSKKIKSMKAKLKTFLKDMKQYMEEQKQTENIFMKVLCDDVYIAYRTLGTSICQAFTSARQASQGQQRSYHASNIYNQEDEDDDDDDDKNKDVYLLSQQTDSPYKTSIRETIMKTINNR